MKQTNRNKETHTCKRNKNSQIKQKARDQPDK